jgi:hypothetical protein
MPDGEVMYFHGDHVARAVGRVADVGRCRLRDGRWGDFETVFRPPGDSGAWDALFVADPFVLEV